MKKVQVLLSTYNGEKYLSEQLNSILEQDYPNISILIRDDGSTDNTKKIIEKYVSIHTSIKYYEGHNIGVIDSFFDLVRKADDGFDYYAFADQDDVWKVNKISKAVEILEAMDHKRPLLYCGKTSLVDSQLEPIKLNIKSCKRKPGFGNALVENINTGCTSVVNDKLLSIVKSHIPKNAIMHDWWFYLIASSFGNVYYDVNSYILYRQHDKNVIGTRSSYVDEFLMRLRRYKSNRGKVSAQIIEFDKMFEIQEDKKDMIRNIIRSKNSIRSRIKLIFNNKIYRQRSIDNFIFKIIFLTGTI